jgi:hypothetical protein
MRAKGFQISHEGVARILKGAGGALVTIEAQQEAIREIAALRAKTRSSARPVHEIVD